MKKTSILLLPLLTLTTNLLMAQDPALMIPDKNRAVQMEWWRDAGAYYSQDLDWSQSQGGAINEFNLGTNWG